VYGGVAGTTINGGNYKFGGQVLDGSSGSDVLLAGKSATIEISRDHRCRVALFERLCSSRAELCESFSPQCVGSDTV